MNNITWVRWKQPLFIFIAGIVLIIASSEMLSFYLFKHEVKRRLDNLHYFYQDRYLSIGGEIEQLADAVSFTCNKNDIALMRKHIEESPAIQLIELHTKDGMCSIYGNNSELVKKLPNQTTINDNKFAIESYLHNRLKITINDERGMFIVITEPFEQVFLRSELCKDCYAVELHVEDQFLPLFEKEKNETYFFIASQQFTKRIFLNVYSTKLGITSLIKADVIFVQAILCIILLLICLLLGLLKGQNSTLKELIYLGLKNKEFIPFYQPIIDSSSKQVVGCEILVRWIKKNGEIISPNLFIPIAEYNGQIFELTYDLLNQVSADIGKFALKHPDFYVSLNVVPEQLEDDNFAENVFKILKNHNIEANHIAFEVTERTPFTNLKKAERVINQLKNQKIDIKLDDAGTGYGGFSYLQELPIDTLKIDKMFVETIGTNDVKSKILSSIILFGKNAGLKMIAEGVESQEQVDYLNLKGITLMQGYYYAKPMPFEEFTRYYYGQNVTMYKERN
ncbi:EAL domain-containing protein [Photobacterium profundum]|uniref:EAL domain-containing protein n=2 Tax=Photobacterium profundum TaxID=74109 RepID=Q1Z8P6_9GAMM|nr:EAL domain-containing protein [Photobacterium profundum]EAS45062.1 hypothetical protein P3TCK_21300 [Photobacterium profundum 3TCK]